MAFRSKKHFRRKHTRRYPGTRRSGFRPQAFVKDSLGMVTKTTNRVIPKVNNNSKSIGSKFMNFFGMFRPKYNKSRKNRR